MSRTRPERRIHSKAEMHARKPAHGSNDSLSRDRELVQRLAKAQQREEYLRQEIARLENELDRRQSTIAAMCESTSWKLTEPLRGLVRWHDRVRLLFGRQLRLVPISDLEQDSTNGTVTEWKMTGNDPHFALQPMPRGLQPGHYRIEFSIPQGGATLSDPEIYVDGGGALHETPRHALRLATSGMVASTYFSVAEEAGSLRFDPSNEPGAVVLGPALLRRIWRWEYYARLAFGAARDRIRSPGDVLRYARKAFGILRSKGFSGLASTLRRDLPPGGTVSYADWIARHDFDEGRDGRRLKEALATLTEHPLISVIMPAYNTPENLLREAIDSVCGQIYENWELCIADDRSSEPHVRKILDEYVGRDHRIKVVYRGENGHISRASNSALEMVTGEWIALLDHDDILRSHALAEVALEIDRHPEAELIYSDEDKLDTEGKRRDPFFKPDFSRELFRSQNYLNHLTVHRTENVRSVGGWRPGFEGSQDYDLNLRIFETIDPGAIRHIPKILYHWRAVEGSTALEGAQKSYAYSAGFRALEEHVERMHLPAAVEETPGYPFYRLRFRVPEPQPLVSLIIPTRDKVELLRGCIGSIRAKTTYSNYEIIVVDNGSTEAETLAYFEELRKSDNIRILPYDHPFNYSAINNFAVSKARGSIIGLINNDIEVIAPDWLTEMVSWAVQPDIGCVGAKLYYADDTIQHAGVILGIGGVAGHSHKYFPGGAPGYFSRLMLMQDISAVTGACLLVRKEIFEAIGGLNRDALAVAFNDVDFCLRVREAGYLNVWTPYAELYHHESKSRGAEDNPEKAARFLREASYMTSRWAGLLSNDPYYSPNLTLAMEDFSLRD